MIETNPSKEILPRIIIPSVQTVLLKPGDRELEIYLGLRSTNSHRLQWCPPGGKVDPGETDRRAGVRELEEEAGIIVPERSLFYFKDMPPSLTAGEFDGRAVMFQNAVRVFLVDGRGLNPYNASPKEHLEMKWMGVTEAHDMHQRVLASRGEVKDVHAVPGTLTQGTFKTVKWLMGKNLI